MAKQIHKNQFIIKSRRTGNRLADRKNQVVYEVYTADGKKCVKSGFYRKEDANKWLSTTVKIANSILSAKTVQTDGKDR